MITRSLDKAKAAFKNQDPAASRKAHQVGIEGAVEEHKQDQGKYIKSLVYGGLDGIITTFAVVAGVAGAALSPGIVLILGFANLIADGLSMAIGDYLSTKAEQEYSRAERERELWEVRHYPEGEKQEMVELYVDKGIPQKDAETVVDILSKNDKAWVDIMMVEELGIVEDDESPVKNALVTFFSFLVFGFIPVVAYVIARFLPAMENTFLLAAILTGVTLFLLGALKVRITGMNWFKSGFEMLLVGGIAAGAAYGIGVALSGLA
jgi:VIT1/CCC1 family predicted Fe2+/Mn2+ transporter